MKLRLSLVFGLLLGTTLPPLASAADSEEWKAVPIEHRGRQGEVFAYHCPAVDEVPRYMIWGTDYYTDDSSVCVAAVHWDRITREGGTVYIQMEGARERYKGTSRNGVMSMAYGEFEGSFVFVDKPAE